MFEDIQKHRQAVRENIEKSLQIGFTESEDFEKAHQVGDIHPNGKWVWTQLPSGKFDWRVIKKKDGQGTGAPAAHNNPQAILGNKPAPTAKTAEKELKEKLPEVKFTSSDFKKEKMEREEGDRKDALQLYWHVGPKTEYYDDDGKKKTATPEINEFYSDYSQKHLGGYEIRFDYAGPIGSFRTLNEAVSALNDWVNKKRVKNHPKPKWIYNASKGDYQMNYKL